MASQSKQLHDSDEPLGRVVLIPLDSVTVIHGELVMEVVVSLANCHERGNHVVPGSVLVIEWSLAEPMRQRVDTERRLKSRRDQKPSQDSFGQGTAPSVRKGLTW